MDEKAFKQRFLIWNREQKALKELLGDAARHDEAIALFLKHHGEVHSRQVREGQDWSFVDVLLEGVSQEQLRMIPAKEEHSLAWLFWHMARVEDVTMNYLVAGDEQLFYAADWDQRLQTSLRHTGNTMEETAVAGFSQSVNAAALLDYRTAVGQRTQEIVQGLSVEDLRRKVDPQRTQEVLEQGDVAEAASGITDYWSKRTVAGLLLMPATRHNMVHLNEGLRVRKKIDR